MVRKFVAVCAEPTCSGRREFEDAAQFLRPPRGKRKPRCPACEGPMRRRTVEELVAEDSSSSVEYQRIHALRVGHAGLHRHVYLDSGD